MADLKSFAHFFPNRSHPKPKEGVLSLSFSNDNSAIPYSETDNHNGGNVQSHSNFMTKISEMESIETHFLEALPDEKESSHPIDEFSSLTEVSGIFFHIEMKFNDHEVVEIFDQMLDILPSTFSVFNSLSLY